MESYIKKREKNLGKWVEVIFNYDTKTTLKALVFGITDNGSYLFKLPSGRVVKERDVQYRFFDNSNPIPPGITEHQKKTINTLLNIVSSLLAVEKSEIEVTTVPLESRMIDLVLEVNNSRLHFSNIGPFGNIPLVYVVHSSPKKNISWKTKIQSLIRKLLKL